MAWSKLENWSQTNLWCRQKISTTKKTTEQPCSVCRESQPTNQRCALLQEMIRNQQDFQCIYVTISNFESHSKCRQCKPMMERYIWFHFVLLTFWLKRARDQWYLITVYSLIGQFQLNLSLVKFTVNVWEYFYSPSFVFHSLPDMSKCFFRPKNQSFSWFCLLDGFLLDINSIAQLVYIGPNHLVLLHSGAILIQKRH